MRVSQTLSIWLVQSQSIEHASPRLRQFAHATDPMEMACMPSRLWLGFAIHMSIGFGITIWQTLSVSILSFCIAARHESLVPGTSQQPGPTFIPWSPSHWIEASSVTTHHSSIIHRVQSNPKDGLPSRVKQQSKCTRHEEKKRQK